MNGGILTNLNGDIFFVNNTTATIDLTGASIVNEDTIAMTVQKRTKTDTAGLRKNFEKLTKELNAYIDAKKAENKKVAVWGASHQGFTAVSSTLYVYSLTSSPSR